MSVYSSRRSSPLRCTERKGADMLSRKRFMQVCSGAFRLPDSAQFEGAVVFPCARSQSPRECSEIRLACCSDHPHHAGDGELSVHSEYPPIPAVSVWKPLPVRPRPLWRGLPMVLKRRWAMWSTNGAAGIQTESLTAPLDCAHGAPVRFSRRRFKRLLLGRARLIGGFLWPSSVAAYVGSAAI
jgi:hypothetical protein